MRVVLVRNDAAGSADGDEAAAIADVLGSLGAVEVVEPRSVATLAGEIRGAVHPGDIVAVAGGDGSFNLTLNALDDRIGDLSFGLLPSGTGNDLARTLGIPLDAVAAAEALVDGREREVDLALASSRTVERRFVNACMGGFPIEVDRRVDEDVKRRIGPLAFWWGGLKAARDLERYDVGLGDERMRDVVAVGIGNGRSAGGGIPVFPGASLSDGLLDVCTFSAAGAVAAARLVLKVRGGDHAELPGVETRRAARIRLTALPRLELNVDGEQVGLTTPATFEVIGRILVRS